MKDMETQTFLKEIKNHYAFKDPLSVPVLLLIAVLIVWLIKTLNGG